MGRRLQAWGNQDLRDQRLNQIIGPLKAALRRLPSSPQAWKSIPQLLAASLEDANAKIVRTQDLLDSQTGLPDDTWYSRRPIGAGSYGVAALFEKVDHNGQVVDELVIKTALTRLKFAISKDYPTVPKEARIMSLLNRQDDEAILYLRALKTVVTLNEEGRFGSNSQIWRYYLEAAPHGDLERLRIRYRAWGKYLPEPFLWHVFKGLMEAAKTMECGPFEYLGEFGKEFPNSYIIHCDIKPENIFLGNEKQKDGPVSEFYYFPNYPLPKVADFGLAKLTAYSDNGNSPWQFLQGTRLYFPPEIRIDKLKDWFDWMDYVPFKRAPREPERTTLDPNYARHRITSAANIWAIGVVMYQLVTLNEARELSNLVEQMDENKYEAQGGKVLTSLSTKQDPDYSDDLFDLVVDCLHMTPEKRPTPQNALERIDRWLQEYHEYIQMDLTMQNGPKVFYKANDINHMALGSFDFELSDRWWRGYFNKHEIWLDERWGRLNPPHRPEHLDPWPRGKRNRDETLVPESAWQRQDQRRKRRKTDADGDVIVDKAMEDRIRESRPIISNANQMFTFPFGFQNLPKRTS